MNVTPEYLISGEETPAESLYRAYTQAPENLKEDVRRILQWNED